MRELGPLSTIAFAGDYLANSSAGSAHLTGLSAAEKLIEKLGG